MRAAAGIRIHLELAAYRVTGDVIAACHHLAAGDVFPDDDGVASGIAGHLSTGVVDRGLLNAGSGRVGTGLVPHRGQRQQGLVILLPSRRYRDAGLNRTDLPFQ